MRYENIRKGSFVKRPNRFLALAEIEGKMEVCHVKNTGRLGELLIPGAEIYLEEHPEQAKRKTRFSLIGVKKDGQILNIDSQAPNKAVYEWIKAGGLIQGVTLLRPEYRYLHSRFDFYAETENAETKKKILIEVKGVTLEERGIAMFPDAPTERGVRHIMELTECLEQGYEAFLVFVIQLTGVKWLEPNDRTQPAFGEALRAAAGRGVHILAVDCTVTPEELWVKDYIPVRLFKEGDGI